MVSVLKLSSVLMINCLYQYLFVSHCFYLMGILPQKLIETTIALIIKIKCGNISSSNNYRPIALATIISKLLESTLLIKCEEYLSTSASQFGFMKTHGTELCIYTLTLYSPQLFLNILEFFVHGFCLIRVTKRQKIFFLNSTHNKFFSSLCEISHNGQLCHKLL